MFSSATKSSIRAVANRASAMWQWAGAVGFDWFSLLSMVLTFIQTNCKPKTESARNALIADMAKRCAEFGYTSCIEACMSAARARKLRKKMANREGISDETEQDKAFYAAVCAANADRKSAVKGMTSAYNGDETDE